MNAFIYFEVWQLLFTGAAISGTFFFIGYFLGRYSVRPRPKPKTARPPLTVDGKRAR